MLTPRQTITRLVFCLLLSLGLHAAAVWFEWPRHPPATLSAGNIMEVSLVTASSVAPQTSSSPATFKTPDELRRRLTKVAEPAEPVPLPSPLPQASVSEQPLAAAPLVAAGPATRAVRKVGPESVFQCIDLVCASRVAEVMSIRTDASPGKDAPRPLTAGSPGESAGHYTPDSDLIDAKLRTQNNPLPEYPYLARQRHWEGRVWLLATVSVQGLVSDLEVAESSGYAVLDKSAVQTVRRWRFLPATRAGIPVESRVKVPVEFRLQD
jgi:protein TonB